MGRHSSGERRSRLVELAEGGATGARADLRMLVHTRRLLVQCVAAVVLIFAVYLGVLLGLGRSGDWLLLLIIPAGLAGLSVGALLDRAHRMQAAAPAVESVGGSNPASDLAGGLDEERK